jgi:hypothetical protein
MSRLICALSLLNNVLRRDSLVWINSRYTLRFSLISFTILAGNGVPPGAATVLGDVLYINGAVGADDLGGVSYYSKVK